MATTGRSPAMAMPDAAVTACCSAMPTSKNRSGKRSPKGRRPVESGMAAVMGGPFPRGAGRGGVPPPLLRPDVDDDRAVPRRCVGQRPLDGLDVVPVDGPRVADAQLLEEGRGLPQLAHGGLGRLRHPP